MGIRRGGKKGCGYYKVGDFFGIKYSKRNYLVFAGEIIRKDGLNFQVLKHRKKTSTFQLEQIQTDKNTNGNSLQKHKSDKKYLENAKGMYLEFDGKNPNPIESILLVEQLLNRSYNVKSYRLSYLEQVYKTVDILPDRPGI